VASTKAKSVLSSLIFKDIDIENSARKALETILNAPAVKGQASGK